jgi:ORF6N domain-containing protein
MEIENIGSLIYVLRGQRVMLDYDLAAIYDTEVLQLKRQVRRHLERFPKDFMLTLTREEYEALRCQIGILKHGQHSKYPPFAFTEQGVAMLSGVLSSPRAVEANIAIMRAFVRLRSALVASKELSERVNEIERTQTSHEKELGEHAVDIHEVFVALRKMRAKSPRRRLK